MSTFMRCVGVGDVAGFGSGGFAITPIFAATDNFWVTTDIRFPASFINYRFVNPGQPGYVMDAYGSSGGTTVSFKLESTDGLTGHLETNFSASAAGSFLPDVWYTVQFQIVRTPGPNTVTVDVYVDGVFVHSYATTNTVQYDSADFGLSFLTVADADQTVDYDNIRVGTSSGNSNLFGPVDFEDLSIAPPFEPPVIDPSGTGASIFVTSEPDPPPGPVPTPTGAFVVLDDVDVTEFCVEGSVTKRLNGVDTASVKLNMRMAGSALLWGTHFPGAGSYLKVYFLTSTSTTPVLWHHGRVLSCETSADENSGYTVFNSSNPLELWAHRPVRDPPDIVPPPVGYGQPGNFSKPYLLEQFGDPADNPGENGAPRVVQAMIQGSEDNPIPSDSEGPLRLAYDQATPLNSFAAGVVGHGNVKGAPKDWPMTMAEMASNLTATGICDIVVTPIEFDIDLNYGQINVYNGDYGDDLSTSVAFQYGLGAFNVRALRWNEDMTNLCNKLWYYLGPKCDDQHWPANVQGDDPAFNSDGNVTGAWALANTYTADDVVTNNGASFICVLANTSSTVNEPGVATGWSQWWTYWMVPPGGRLAPPASTTNNPLGAMIRTSRSLYDARMDIQIFDGQGGDGPCVEGNVINHDLWRWQWQNEAWLRAFPRNLIHITPTRDTGIGDFDIGDLVLVEATTEVKGGFSGVQRVYQYTISWDSADSVPAVSELQTSSDQEGFQ